LADLDGLQVGEDRVKEQVSEGVRGVIHEGILRGVGIVRRITGEWALVMSCGRKCWGDARRNYVTGL
jgi:hypothetical protein